ncbi:hypothetical protein [Glutamicibacter sp. X7]
MRSQVSKLDIERHALWAGAAGSVLGLIVALIVFAGRRPPLAGGLSVGSVSALTAGAAVVAASVWGFRQLLVVREPWLADIPPWRKALTMTGLVLVHSGGIVMALSTLFYLAQQAFFGLDVDALAGSLFVAAATGIGCYIALGSTARTDAASLAGVLGVFMVAGVSISMLLAEELGWWRVMFSALGTSRAGAGSFWTFNTTLVVSGLVLASLTEFLTRDLARLGAIYRQRVLARPRRWGKVFRPRPWFVRWCLLLVAAAVVFIGLVPVAPAESLHSAFVRIAAAGMMVLFAGSLLLFPGFPAAFHLFSVASLIAVVLANLLWTRWHYYNLTGFELVAVAICFGWLSVFIRTTAAMVEGIES